jgi:DNA-binding NarL/FixJ family response regulator
VTEPGEPSGGKRLRVLIADDHVPSRRDVRRTLEEDGRFEVCCEAGNAAEAVEGALAEQPDLCLLDVHMPGNGIAATWEIVARLPDTKVVMLTISDADADLFGSLQAGATSYLLKDMDPRRLPHALCDAWSGKPAIPPILVARMVDRLHGTEARRRALAQTGQARLTSREWQVLRLLADELSTNEIARRLVLTASAVRAHISSIVKKLGVQNRDEAIDLFRARGTRERGGGA